MKPGRGLVSASFVVVSLTAGCGGSDEIPAADTAETTADTPAGVPPTPDEAPPGSDAPAPPEAPSAPPSGGGGGGLGMGAETWAKQLKVALRADEYSVDGNTVTLVLGGGESADSESDCSVAAATSGTNVAVVLAYPDGDVSC